MYYLVGTAIALAAGLLAAVISGAFKKQRAPKPDQTYQP